MCHEVSSVHALAYLDWLAQAYLIYRVPLRTDSLSVRRYLALRSGDNKIEYYNARKDDEVDFLVTEKVTKRRRLVQVSWELSRKTTEDRELSALKDARDEIKVSDCSVVTWDSEGETEGVRIFPVWKWCLEEASLRGGEDR